MLNKKHLFWMLLMLMYSTFSFAQEITVHGKVTDKTGSALAGANIVLKGERTVGTVADVDGKFNISAKSGDELTFSYMGYVTKTLTVNGQDMVVVLNDAANSVKEVVVTALGIKKNKNTLGYATQSVEGATMEKAKEGNAMSQLTGKVAGLDIHNSPTLFDDPDIELRGRSGVLVVIDGIPNTSDIWKLNADDIEKVDVLKGSVAAALFGSKGLRGAIMITTKKGEKGKTHVSFNNSTMFQSSFLRVPKVQTQYGDGYNGQYAYVDGSGRGSEGGGWIWGPKLDQKDSSTPSGYWETAQYNSPVNPTTGKLIPLPWISRGKNNVKNFFRTGVLQSNNISVDWGGKIGNYRVSLSNIYQYGVVPNTDLNNTSFMIGGTMNPVKGLNISGTLTYNKQYTKNFPEMGYGPSNYLYDLVLWTGTDVDVRDLKNYWVPGKKGIQQRNYNISWYNNPYFVAYEYMKSYDKNNTFGNVSVSYEFLPGLTGKVVSGINNSSLFRDYKIPKSFMGYSSKSEGDYSLGISSYFDINTTASLVYEKIFSPNFRLKAEGGYINYYSNQRYSKSSTDGLTIPGFYSLSNSINNVTSSSTLTKWGTNSFYGYLDLDIFKAGHLSVTGRNDKTSTLPIKSNSYFYPSVTGSLVISDMVKLPEWLTYAKVRGGYMEGRSGSGPNGVYSFITAYEAGTKWGDAASVYYPSAFIGSSIKSQLEQSWEVGSELRFLNNRIYLDATYYNTLISDALKNVSLSGTTGYNSAVENYQGKTGIKGWEISINGDPVRTDCFKWNTLLNMSHYRNYQVKLAPGEDYGIDLAKKGQRIDGIYAWDIQKNAQGQIITGKDGMPRWNPYETKIGYSDPDLIYGLTNTLNYKNWTLSFSFDGSLGGLLSSSTIERMLWGGTSPETVNKYRDDANEGKSTYVVPNSVIVTGGSATFDPNTGVITSDSRTYGKNNTAVNYSAYMQTYNRNLYAWHYFKRDFIKLRELMLTYNFDKKMLNKLPFSGVNVSLIGRNLWLLSKIKDIDPEVGDGNLQTPAMRSYGFNINIQF
jgi:TonB-linked SusC/RagA family outer membrane protein